MQVLAEAAKHVEAETPWFAAVGLRYDEVAERAGDLAVEAVLAYNVVSGLVDAANVNALAPVFVALKGLLGAAQGTAAGPAEEVLELIRYCLGISTCLLEAAKLDGMSRSVAETLGELEAVGRFVQTYGTQSSVCCSRMASNSHDRDTAAGHKQRLKDLLDTVLAGLSVQVRVVAKEPKKTVSDRDPPRCDKDPPRCERDPPRLRVQAEISREVPVLPTTFVQRTALMGGVVADLTDPHRSASATHCLLGRGGGGKTLMASSVVRDNRVRASFKDGIFWVRVGREGKDVALLLEHLAVELSRAPTDKPHTNTCPDRFNGAGEVLQHLSAVRKQNNLRCLVVLDNVWDAEVVNAFASTGFHILVTARQREVLSPAHPGVCTEVGSMLEDDALEVLRKASGAHGPIPAEEARKARVEARYWNTTVP